MNNGEMLKRRYSEILKYADGMQRKGGETSTNRRGIQDRLEVLHDGRREGRGRLGGDQNARAEALVELEDESCGLEPKRREWRQHLRAHQRVRWGGGGGKTKV